MTHVFHPLHGRHYQLVSYRRAWGEERVYFHDETGGLRLVPASWTDVVPRDAFVEMAEGRSHFRVDDLLQLAVLVEQAVGEREE